MFKYEISTSTKSKINCSFEDGNNNIIPYVNDFISLNKVPGSSSYLLTTENIVTGVNSNQPCGTYKGTFFIDNFNINGTNAFKALKIDQLNGNDWGWNAAGKPVANPNTVTFTNDAHLIIGKSGTTFSTTSPITATTFNWQQLYTESKNNTAPCSYTSYKNLGFVNSVSKCIYPQDIGGGNFRLWKGEFDRGMFISNDNGESFSQVSITSTMCESILDWHIFAGNTNCHTDKPFSDCSFITNNNNSSTDLSLYAGISKGFSTSTGEGNIAVLDINGTTQEWNQLGDTKCGDPLKTLFAPVNLSAQNKYVIWNIENTNLSQPYPRQAHLYYLTGGNTWDELNLFNQPIIDYKIADAFIAPFLDGTNNEVLYVLVKEATTGVNVGIYKFVGSGATWTFSTSDALTYNNGNNFRGQKLDYIGNGSSNLKIMIAGYRTNTNQPNKSDLLTIDGDCTNNSLIQINNGFTTDFQNLDDEGIKAINVNAATNSLFITLVKGGKVFFYKGFLNGTGTAILPYWIDITDNFPNKQSVFLNSLASCGNCLFACTRGMSSWKCNVCALSVSAQSTNVLCYGAATGTITATAVCGAGSLHYQLNGGTAQPSGNFNNLIAGTYTVTATDGNGTTATFTATITEPALALSCSATKTDITCYSLNNGNATVTAAGGTTPYTYLWSTNAITSTTTSLQPGTYTVTVTDDNGCIATSSVIIAQPAQLTISFTQTNLPGCIGSNFGVNTFVTGGTQPFTFNWSNGTNTANLTNLDPNISNYTLIVNDANGCSMLEPFTLQNDNTCCGIFTNNFTSTSGIFNLLSENLNADLVVNGTLTLTNSTLDIYSGVSIILDDATDVLTLDACHLYACSNMWQGIINNGGTVNIINGTILEDAQEALRTSNNGIANVTESIFNHNFKNLIFKNGDYSNATIWGNTFQCTGAYTGLKAPHVGERTSNYIELNNVTNIKIGDETQTPNTFNTAASFGADRGVTGKISTAIIYNNVFNSFDTDADQTNTKGQAIYMDGDDGITYSIPTNIAVIGNINIANSGNTFADCKVGIDLKKQNATVEENTITNTPQPLTTMPFVQGVYVHDGFKFNVTIRHNKIINSDKGVCIDALNNVYGTVNIVDDNHLDCKPTTTNVYSAAVRIADVNATHSESAGYLIANNKNDALDEIDQGIHSTGMYGINIMNVFTTIKENIVYLDASNYTKMKTGIKTENGLMPTILCNQIKGYDVNDITMRTAISTEFSAMTTLECNITHRTEIGIDFVSDCNFSVIKGNSMFYHTIGFQLGAKFNGGNSWSTGIIGDQATYQNGNNTYTLGNRFYGTNGNGAFGFSSMHSINSNASANQWIFVNNLSHKPPLPPYTLQVVGNYLGSVLPFSPFWDPQIIYSYTCDNTCVVTHPDPHRTQLENEINGIIYGDTTNSVSDVLLYYSRAENVIGETNRDSSLADSSTIIADFIAAQQSTFLGKMLKAEEILNLLLSNNGNATSLKTLALDLLDDVPPQYIFEQNALDLVILILNHNGIIDGKFLNQGERQIVESIASQCPFKGGKAVYRARAIVWTYNPAMIFDNDDLCNDGAYFRNGIMPSNYAFYVAPNPTNENTIFYYQLQAYDNVNLQIVDVDGKVISTVDLETKKAQANLDVVNFANGIYTIKILARGSLIGCARLVIIK
nr:T9SS type A sorting domain-containing protein [Bacteroidota bacterium]